VQNVTGSLGNLLVRSDIKWEVNHQVVSVVSVQVGFVSWEQLAASNQTNPVQVFDDKFSWANLRAYEFSRSENDAAQWQTYYPCSATLKEKRKKNERIFSPLTEFGRTVKRALSMALI
jgi:hypothetical protein